MLFLASGLVSCGSFKYDKVEPRRPNSIAISGLHESISSHYYGEAEKIVLVNALKGTSEEVALPGCAEPVICENIVLVVCGVDGAKDYIDNENGVLLESCGGQCNFGFSDNYEECKKRCPPKQWKCN